MSCCFVALIHTVACMVVVPHPVAREPLRRKVIALTESDRPSLIIAGDSRAQVHVNPRVVAQKIGWPEDRVINIGLFLCDTSAVLAAHREFSERFAAAPIMVISVSLYSVNDGATDEQFIGDEVLWSVGPLDRFRLVSIRRALLATFLPERALWRLVAGPTYERPKTPANSPLKKYVNPVWHRLPAGGNAGFKPAPHLFQRAAKRGFAAKAEDESKGFSREVVEGQARELKRYWYGTPELQGIRWRQFRADLRSLRDAGVQVVILDSPVHPAFSEVIAGTAIAEADARFHRQLSDLCERMGVPVLRYEAGDFPEYDPDDIFFNLTHLNRTGATLLSQQVGRDLRRLLSRGELHVPTDRVASTRRH